MSEAGSARRRSRGVDLDELARLEDERDFLLRSIEDLDAEHEAGDVDGDDYTELRDGYVARAAAVIRRIEAGETELDAARAAAPRRRGRSVVWVGAVVGFAVLAGFLLAGQLGARGSGTITGAGAVPGGDAEQCRMQSFREPAKGVRCYEKLLADRPDDVEALTYQGWAKVRSGDVAGGSANFDRVVELEPTFPDVRVFRASVAKDAGDFVTAQAELDALYDLNPAPALLSTMQQMGLERTVAEGLLPDDVARCWKQERDALGAVNDATNVMTADDLDREQLAAAFADLARSTACLDAVLAARPDDADALTLRSLGVGLLGILDDAAVPRAAADVARVLELRPDDPTARLLHSVWTFRLDDLDGAAADLDALGERRVSPLVGEFVDRGQVAAEIESARAAGSTTTTSTSPTK